MWVILENWEAGVGGEGTVNNQLYFVVQLKIFFPVALSRADAEFPGG